jgi:HlyD family secretion protein
MRRRLIRLGLMVIVIGMVAGYYTLRGRASTLVLTGLVTTDDVIVSAQVPGQIAQLLIAPGQSVTKDQVIAIIHADELRADRAYYSHVADGATAGIEENQAALRFQEQQNVATLHQAEASLASAEASRASAAADLENAKLVFQRSQQLQRGGLTSTEAFDQARTALEATQARVQMLDRQVEAARAAVALAQSNTEQAGVRRSQLEASRSQSAAAAAQRDKADVRLGYAEVKAPIAGIVDVRAARQGEVVSAGQPIATLIDQSDLWIRLDIEETYIEKVRLGDRLTVTLPSGEEREGTVFYRGADAGFATERDVSRTKRDIRTFEVRLRVPDPGHQLAVGMTAYVRFPVPR